MALSNTATPKYYGLFRDQVVAGLIPVNQTVSMQMCIIDQLIADPNYWHDDEAVEGWIKYCEDELTLTDGSDVILLDSFKLWAEDVLSWFYFIDKPVFVKDLEHGGGKFVKKRVKKRLRNRQFLLIARSGAKSLYASFLQNYMLNVDSTTTHQITVAPTMKLAEEVVLPIKTSIIRAKGPYFKFLTEKNFPGAKGPKGGIALSPTKRGIENFITGSYLEIRPMRIDKLQGLQVKMATVDEWLSCDIRENPLNAIEQGAAKVKDYLIIATSSEGTIRNGIGDTIKMELLSILKGEYFNPFTSIWWYALDNIEEVNCPELWLKANPNLGITVSYETYQQDVEKAEKSPSSRNDIMAKRFGIPMEGYTYFFTYEETIPHKKKAYNKMQCALGIDLSRGDDFCAFTFLFPIKDGSFGIKSRSYISSTTFGKLSLAMRQKYQDFIAEQSLVVMDCVNLNMIEVYDDLTEYIDKNQYQVCSVGYDPYNAKEFIERWETENSSYCVEAVIQGSKTESVPLGELKKLAELNMLMFDESIMSFAMGNCIVQTDSNGNRKLYKLRHQDKIDPVAALLDAYVSYKRSISEYY